MLENEILKHIGQMNKIHLDKKSERIINHLVKYALQGTLSELSIRRCATHLKISTSSIMRLSQKLGVSGFNSLKDHIENLIVSLKFSGQPDCLDHFAKLENRLGLAQHLMNETLKNNKKAIFSLMNDLLLKCDTHEPNLIVHGIGISGLVASYFTSKLNKVGVNASMFELLSCHESEINKLKQNNIMILISKSGETPSILEKITLLTHNPELITYSITSNQTNSLGKRTDHNIKVMFNKHNSIDLNNQALNYDSIIFQLIDSIIQLYLFLKNSQQPHST